MPNGHNKPWPTNDLRRKLEETWLGEDVTTDEEDVSRMKFLMKLEIGHFKNKLCTEVTLVHLKVGQFQNEQS